MASKETIKLRLTNRKLLLEEAYRALDKLMRGEVKQYTIGSRSLTRFDISELWDMIHELEKEVDQLESMLTGGKRRKAVGVVPRDI